jgi:hypothetical protein
MPALHPVSPAGMLSYPDAMDALHVLLHGSIDYAGLFPPAGFDMSTAVHNYAAYRQSADAWALGRFVLPVARIQEFESVSAGLLPLRPAGEPWRIAALAGGSLEEFQSLGEFNCRHAADGAQSVSADVVELKADSVDTIERVMGAMPGYLQAYIEIPLDRDPAELIAAIGRAGARAKVRTGGVTVAAFPPARNLVRFLVACTAAGVQFKATAGLHHPLRAEYRLTYESDSESGTMYGFLNLFLAAAFLRAGMDPADAARLLEERTVEAFRFEGRELSWNGHRLDRETLHRARRDAIISFGSCSFTEPLEDLRSLGLL